MLDHGLDNLVNVMVGVLSSHDDSLKLCALN